MVESERCINIVDVVEKMKEIQVVFPGQALRIVLEAGKQDFSRLEELHFVIACLRFLHSFHHSRFLLVGVAGICEQQFCEISLSDVAVTIRVFALKLQAQNLSLQLLLELQELLNG